jgi:hypothetical protein
MLFLSRNWQSHIMRKGEVALRPINLALGFSRAGAASGDVMFFCADSEVFVVSIYPPLLPLPGQFTVSRAHPLKQGFPGVNRSSPFALCNAQRVVLGEGQT